MSNVDRSTEGLRDMIFDTIDGLQNGSVSIEHAKMLTKASDSIMKTVAIDLLAQKMASKAETLRHNPQNNLNLTLSKKNLRN